MRIWTSLQNKFDNIQQLVYFNFSDPVWLYMFVMTVLLCVGFGQDFEKGLIIVLSCVQRFLGGPCHFTLRICSHGKR